MYLYLHFYERATHVDSKLNLDPNEIRMLNLVAKAYITKRAIYVSDLIRQNKVASQATLHKALKKLASKKLVYSIADIGDARRRRITLTPQAIQRYKKLDKLIYRANEAQVL